MPTPKQYKSGAERTAAYRKRLAQAKPTSTPYATLKPGYRRWELMLQHTREILDTVYTEMEDYHSDRSETWQESEKGEVFQDRMDVLQEVLDSLNELD